MTPLQFRSLMQTIASAWNAGNAKRASDCFAEDAVYTEPPDAQVYIGRTALYQFFGADRPPVPPMSMTWHHLAFDPDRQIGFGEYTFQMNQRYHGIVVVRVAGGKVRNWREYQYRSDLVWEAFIGANAF